eukprot:scaffold419_cov185-Chaetoceros_neogracile.AAC.3
MSTRNWHGSYYEFGSWGYRTDQFVATPPGIEVSGEYDVVFVAACEDAIDNREDDFISNADVWLRETTNKSNNVKNLVIKAMPRSFSATIFPRKVKRYHNHFFNTYERMFPLDLRAQHFGPGYDFFGCPSLSFGERNVSTIKKELNNNIGQLYVVSDRKAFRLIDRENPLRIGGIVYESQEHEVQVAEENCENFRKRHLSFLCRDLGLPCQVASQISQYLIAPPFVFAEPGDVWIDLRLKRKSMINYVLVRRRKS